jgi:hypothetical protein
MEVKNGDTIQIKYLLDDTKYDQEKTPEVKVQKEETKELATNNTVTPKTQSKTPVKKVKTRYDLGDLILKGNNIFESSASSEPEKNSSAVSFLSDPEPRGRKRDVKREKKAAGAAKGTPAKPSNSNYFRYDKVDELLKSNLKTKFKTL